jgi:hypothetical protein
MSGVVEFTAMIQKPLVLNRCWIWLGGQDGRGYGNFQPRKRHSIHAHRFAYQHLFGPIPKGLVIDHLCRNTICVNPWHLEAVTQKENVRRHFALRTVCTRGHQVTPENIYRRPSGQSECLLCKKFRATRGYADTKM